MSPSDEWVAVAAVLRPHALRGAVILKAFTRTPDELVDAPVDKVWVRRNGRIERELTITHLAMHSKQPLAEFEEIEDRNGAEALAGAELVIKAADRWDLDEGACYADDLPGLAVVGADGTAYGPVLRVDDGPAHDFLVFANPLRAGKEVLLPFVDEFVHEVDFEGRQVRISIPEGLLEL